MIERKFCGSDNIVLEEKPPEKVKPRTFCKKDKYSRGDGDKIIPVRAGSLDHKKYLTKGNPC